MNLDELRLNRFLYRDSENQGDGSLAYAAAANASDFSGSGSGGGIPEPGSIITSVILQSSPSDNRIEINPDDTLRAYNEGEVILTIDKDGLRVTNSIIENAEMVNATIEDAQIEVLYAEVAAIEFLGVIDYFEYGGIQQPQVFSGTINGSSGDFIGLTPKSPNSPFSWAGLRVSQGIYLIAHYLNNTNYDVVVSPATGHFRGRVYSKIAGSFLVSFQQTVYGSQSFAVSGGAGGSVTVSGIRVSPFEEPVDTDFNFVLVNHLP